MSHAPHAPHAAHDHDHAHHAHDHAAHAHDHDHAHHDHGSHDHRHDHAGTPQRTLFIALALTLGFAAVEAVTGWLAGSLALLSDAGHMVTDSLSLLLAALAAWMARKPASVKLSYGYTRAEVLAALFNAGFMFGVILFIAVNAVERLRTPQPVDGGTVMWVAAIGLAINLAVAWVLSRGGDHHHNLNTRGALLHVMGDALGSVAALASGLVIRLTGWTPIDPLLSIGICALILVSTVRLAREAVHTLMEGVPQNLSAPEVGRAMAAVPGVREVHDLHIWSMDSRHAALSAHVTVADMAAWPGVLAALRELLAREFDIDHVTLQPEVTPVVTVPLSALERRPRSATN